MKKLAALSLAALVFASTITGCNEKTDKFGLKTDENVTLTIVGSLDNFEGLEAVIAKFEKKYSNCTIDYLKLDDYSKNLSLRLENNTANTQLFLSGRADFLGESKIVDYALDLADTETKIDISGTNPAITDSQFIDGKLYTVPVAANPRGMLVNTTLLKDNEVSMPKNWQEFLDACEALKNKGYVPIQANNDYLGLGMMYSYFANQIVHDKNYDTVFKTLNDLTEGSGEYLRDSFTRFNTLIEKQYIDYKEADGWKNNYDDAILNFFEGDVAFFPATAETVSGMKKREELSEAFTAKPFEYEFTCIPAGDDGAYCYWQTWNGISINKKAENEDWARAFMDFLLQKENMSLLASIKGMPSNTKSGTDDTRFASLYDIDESHRADPNKFQISYFSQLNKAFQSMTKPLDDPERLDSDGAIEYFEKLIAEKREEQE